MRGGAWLESDIAPNVGLYNSTINISFTIGVPELRPYAPPLEKIMVAKGGK